MKRLILIEEGKVLPFGLHATEADLFSDHAAVKESIIYDGPWPEGSSNLLWDEVTGTVVADIEKDTEEITSTNRNLAIQAQEEVLKKILDDEARVSKGLVSLLTDTDKTALQNYAVDLNADVISPPSDRVYNPPLPPGVSLPTFEAVTIMVTRVPGWNNVLGWRAEISSITPNFVPGNLAMAWYNSPDCTSYVATSGAFQKEASTGIWFAKCPPGFEPGNNIIHLGLLYASAPITCFTLDKDEMSKKVVAY